MRLICILLMLAGSLVGQNPTATYKALLERAKAGDQTVDYRQMREAYFDSENDYDPTDARKQMFQELNAKQFGRALKTADTILEKDYVDIDAHLGAMMANKELGNKEAAAQHDKAIRALLASISGGLDGRSVKTAWIVMEVHEEYAVMRLFGLMPKKQVAQETDGHNFDVMTMTDRESGKDVTIYFNTDKHWAALRKAFGPEKKK